MQLQGSSPDIALLYEEATALLKLLIATPSFSREEDRTADILMQFLQQKNIPVQWNGNNIWAINRHYDAGKPVILLNSHHDTVKPSKGYTLDPFTPIVQDEKLYGLGSNDAGGALVSLLATFLHFYHNEHLSYNLIFAATAEEENSGENGVESILPELGAIAFAIVGEPTQMNLAIAEKGLLVLDCVAKGKAGHAAREEGENAIYKAIKDIEWFRTFQFPKVSSSLGPVKMSVTVMEAGSLHNMVPDTCRFTVDIRCTDAYTHEEMLAIIKEHIQSEATPRSMRLKPSSIDTDHPFVKAGLSAGRTAYGSPTTSDQALMPFTSVKMGPGDSARSHTADEFIYLEEIKEGIGLYIYLLAQIIL